MRYRSAIDPWLLAVLVFAGVLGLLAVAPIVADGVWLLPLAILACSLGLPIWILLSTWYEIRDGLLIIRSGPFRWRIRLSEISAVHPSRSVLSSPALSLDRLRIEYGNQRSILVSPADKQGFMDALDLP